MHIKEQTFPEFQMLLMKNGEEKVQKLKNILREYILIMNMYWDMEKSSL